MTSYNASEAHERDLMEEEATTWFVRLHHDDQPEGHKPAFEEWLAADARHQAAYNEVQSFMQSTQDFTDDPVLEEVFAENLADNGLRRSPARGFVRMAFALAAMVLAVIGGYGFYLYYPLPDVEETLPGEQKVLVLADGSRVKLNTDSKIAISYGRGAREIRLYRGQAWFDVAKENKRPFKVTFEEGHVEALGTSFDVYQSTQGVKVSLLEGSVAVREKRAEAGGALKEVILQAKVNEKNVPQVVLRAGSLSAPRMQERGLVQAWQREQLVFTEAALETVLSEISRYLRQPVKLGDNGMKAVTVTGVFPTDGKKALDILRKYYGWQIIEGDQATLVLPSDKNG